ncbi:MAG: hypothetical protein AAGB00_09620 [Planctomycetota bacterium]
MFAGFWHGLLGGALLAALFGVAVIALPLRVRFTVAHLLVFFVLAAVGLFFYTRGVQLGETPTTPQTATGPPRPASLRTP